jgi:hypothetical protein
MSTAHAQPDRTSPKGLGLNVLVRRAMLVAVGFSLTVHAAGLLSMTLARPGRPPSTDVVGDADLLVLGLDLPAEPLPTPPAPIRVSPVPPQPELLPQPIAEPVVEPLRDPEPAPAPPTLSVDTFGGTPTTTPAPTTPKPTFAVTLDDTAAALPSTPQSHASWPAATSPAEAAKPAEPVASFAGVKADRARRVVYAVDVSGVMVGSLPFVLEEVQRCVARLAPDQEFQVLLFRDPTPSAAVPHEPASDRDTDPNPTFDPPPAAPEVPALDTLYAFATWITPVTTTPAGSSSRPALLPVSEQSRRGLSLLLSGVSPDGASNPLTGLRLALAMKPDVVFLLTRGIRRSGTTWGPGEAQVMAVLDEANPKDAAGHRSTTIRTVQFVAADPSGLMDRIAKDHGGGSVSVLTVADLKAAAKKK